MLQESTKSSLTSTPVASPVHGGITWTTAKPETARQNILKARLRTFLILLTSLWVLAFLSTFLVFHNAWTLFSMPSALAVVGINIGLSWISWRLGRHKLSAAWLSLTIMMGFFLSVLSDGYAYYAGPHALWILILFNLFFTDSEWPVIIHMVASLAIYFVIANIQYPGLLQSVPGGIDPPLVYLVRNFPALIGALIVASHIRSRRTSNQTQRLP